MDLKCLVFTLCCIAYIRDEVSPAGLDNLFKKLFDNYTTQVLPKCDTKQTVQVKVGIALHNIINLNEPIQILECNTWIRMIWNDCNLVWNETETGISNLVVPYDTIWVPDITLYDNAQNDLGGLKDYRPNIYPDGSVYYNFPSIIKSLCRVDVTYFPFDTQQCKLKFGSWSYHGWDVNMTLSLDEGDTSIYVPNGEWSLIGIPAVRHELFYKCCVEPYPDVTFYIQIDRKPLFYLLNLIFPCTLISTMAFLGFILPPDAGEKISLEITVLLSLTVFLLVVSETMPPDSETFPFIGVYFACAMVLVSLSCLMTVTVLNIHFRGNHGKKLPNWVRIVFFKGFGRLLHVKIVPKETRGIKRDLRLANPNNNSNDVNTHEIYVNGGFTHHPIDSMTDDDNNINKMISDSNDGMPSPKNLPEFDKTSRNDMFHILKQQAETLDNIREYIDAKSVLEDSKEEWKRLAQVLDRIFMILFFTCQVGTWFVILLKIATTEDKIDLQQGY